MATYTYNFIKNRRLNCIQLCLINIATIFHCTYEHIFLEIWDFDLQHPVCLGEKYDNSYQLINEHLMELLTLYSPITYEKCEYKNMIAILKNLRREEILLVEMDTFDCPWAVGFLWKHFSYYFIIRIDIDSNKLIGYCPYDDIYNIEINNEVIENALNIYVFRRETLFNTLSAARFKRHLFAKVKATEPDSIFMKMNQFGEMLGELNDFNILKVDDGRIEDNIFVQRLAYIESSRYGMQLLLKKMFNDYTINFEMNEILKRWMRLKNYMIKGIITRKFSIIHDLRDQVISISDLEKAIYDKLSGIDDRIILMYQ